MAPILEGLGALTLTVLAVSSEERVVRGNEDEASECRWLR